MQAPRPHSVLPPSSWHPAHSIDFRRPVSITPRQAISLRGLGAGTAQSAITSIGTSSATVATSIYGALVTTGSVAGPIGAAVGGAIALGLAIYNLVQGCGPTCTEASDIANQVAALLQQNLDNYMSQPVHTVSMQQAAIATFISAWSQLQQMCGNPQLGTAGQNCISQRAASGCQWKTSPSGWSQNSQGQWTYTGAGAAGSGDTCWNWFVGYLYPIQNDPTVVPDSALTASSASGTTAAGGTAASTGNTTTSSTSMSVSPLLIIAAAILVGVLLI